LVGNGLLPIWEMGLGTNTFEKRIFILWQNVKFSWSHLEDAKYANLFIIER
jgi:hypothetical protein